MVTHCQKAHNEEVEKVPNAKPAHDSPLVRCVSTAGKECAHQQSDSGRRIAC